VIGRPCNDVKDSVTTVGDIRPARGFYLRQQDGVNHMDNTVASYQIGNRDLGLSVDMDSSIDHLNAHLRSFEQSGLWARNNVTAHDNLTKRMVH